ncbi:MAG: CoB--CoM heterodisulfide reductase iron-sulfur subunit A family protein [Dehalococcoidales bacterium]|nr:MAG: CoB--CoM heterodisulfide reductase iron-sulfur subunit A family protein [Dehalococcoidales bacterium]
MDDIPKNYKEETDEETGTAIVICSCGNEIGSIIDTEQILEFSKGLPGVVYASSSDFLCQKDGFAMLAEEVKQSRAGKLVIAACPTSIIGRQVNQALKDSGLNNVFTQFINLREGVAWVHRNEPEAATRKAEQLIAMAAERARLQENTSLQSIPVQGGALVLGGGLSGMVAALSIAEQGYEVHLIEKADKLGGNLVHIHNTLTGEDPQQLLSDTIVSIEDNSLINVYLNSEVQEFSGYAGNFNVTISDGEEGIPLQVGSVIVATGGSEYKPEEYFYNESDAVITQSELEERFSSSEMNIEDLESVVMIQCVGSRNAERPYCSRICCSQAIKNSIEVKKRNPDCRVYILYRDMMSYGFLEEYYTKARDAGVMFIRYSEDDEPSVKSEGGKVTVEFQEPALGDMISLETEVVVLSPAILPHESNAGLAAILDLELTENGFFKEAEVKFRPVDFTREGIYACGLALYPRNIGESIAEAQAAAQRAVTLLGRGQLQASPIVAEVNPRWCTGCEICIQACPYGARIKDIMKGIVVVREALCQGCGACAAVCPSGATKLRQFTDKQVFSMIDAGI